MKILIHHTRKARTSYERRDDVKSYRNISFWTVEVTFNDNSIENFYAVERVEELVETKLQDCNEEDFKYMIKGE